ncbi:MAG: heparinase II/III family protein [Acidobacteriota bacterium]|nr:heparinase II/III family protein [Acidobacteriota bacterium]
MNPLLLFRTIEHLRWEQLAYRPLRLAQYHLYRSFPKLAALTTGPSGADQKFLISPQTVETIRTVFSNSFPHLSASAHTLVDGKQQLTDLQDNRFTFLNRSLTLDPPGAVDWNRRYIGHLWNYQLHYFDYVLWAAREAFGENGRGNPEAWHVWQSSKKLIGSWMAEARVGHSDGWDAYPLSLRAVNWIYAYALAADNESEDFLSRWRASIFQQIEFLHRHLEHHLLANHLLKNVKALVIGGLFFENKDWLSEGEYLLWREFEEQVLADGGHYERSPMYHAQALADFLECYALLVAFGRIPRSEKTEAKLRAMAGFLKAMSYTDGSLALFNDAANTAETKPKPLLESARRVVNWSLESSTTNFPQSGYYLWQSPDEQEKMIVDAGLPSVDYNTAHAHCDLLSYELRLNGMPFVVDSGVHGYGGDRFREYCRSTRAHNTVMFDGHEQSEVWSTFRMARRAEPLKVEACGSNDMGETGQTWNFCGSFMRYDGAVIHERRIHRSVDGDWTVADLARQGEVARASSFIHLHPDVDATKAGRTGVLCRCGNQQILIEPFADEGVTISTQIITGSEGPIQGWHFPDFGIVQPSATIQFDYKIDCGQAFGYRIKPNQKPNQNRDR